ncbi:ABC transporter ATP-binding protein [Flavihumibacter petaseus]|uniref:ABC transporter permease/ATP-binding protein n=1 Tax=Flavihumibacter petaseus NBRC 106054 TaxID=1220578 RepID=A0A0E9N5I9_9BACT|nr:ABC transporter ATP-binding protein [Flavihumibacter petaseus]GAO45084.1 ABC transporter permease/ATP-binding protein [Flavihumibacter petaseus NBRC 106054]
MNGEKKIFNTALLRRVFRLAAPYRNRVYLSLALAIALAVLSPVRPYLIQITVNDYIKNGLIDMVVRITLIQMVFLLLETAFRFLFSFITAWLGQTVVKDLRVTVFNRVLHLNLSQFDKTPVGTLTTRTINDIESINEIFSDGLIPIIADLLSIISILVVMFVVDWKLALISLAPFPILILATYIFKESVNRSFIRVRNAVTALNAFVQEHVTGIQIVQAFAAEGREYAKFKKINSEHRNANINAIFAYSVFFPVVEIVLAVSSAILVWWGAGKSLNLPPDQAAALTGKMISFILFLNLLFRPLRVIADKFNVLQMGMVASERVFKLIDNDDVIKTEGSFAPAKVMGKIEFNHVWFAYTDTRYVLKDINFTVQPGETVALVGHTGSGKTSIISLLNRLYHIQQGEIRIDGVNIDDYTLNALRRQTGVVLQDVFLFSGSVMENITLRNPAISREQVEAAARLIGMHQFIEQLPGGYDYKVMERGSTLSLGQRQLLSFIRALLYNPSILILDEATSSVDTESEQLIQQAIDTLISGRTAIVIAHRLSTIRKADKIIVLDKGEIREIGSHEELMARGGAYYSLVESQYEGNRKAGRA